MGLALDLWNSFELHLTGSEYRVINYGEGAHMLANDASNLTITTLCSELDRMDIARPEGVEIVCHNTVPCASGLGSSSTATLAGVVFAHAIARPLRRASPVVRQRRIKMHHRARHGSQRLGTHTATHMHLQSTHV